MSTKKGLMKFFILVNVLAVLISPNALALEVQETTTGGQWKNIDALRSEIILIDKSTRYENVKEYVNIDHFVAKVKNMNPGIRDVELAEEIMRTSGDDEKTIANTPVEKKLEILNCMSITQTESFFIESRNPDADPIQVDEETFYQHVNEVRQKETGFDSGTSLYSYRSMSEPLPEEQWTDGCLLVKENAYKIPRYSNLPGRDVFIIRATAEWVTYPIFKGSDRLAIASAGQKDNNYSPDALAYYDYCDWGQVSEVFQYVEQDYPQVPGMKLIHDSIYGVSVNFDLEPIDDPDRLTYKKLKQISLWYGITTQNDVTSQASYAHATYGLGGISVSLGPEGISFSAPITQGWQEFRLPSFTLLYDHPYE